MIRKEKEIQNREVLDELLRSAPVCRIGLATGAEGADGQDEPYRDYPYAGYPYVVPVHFVYADGRIYIHSAWKGRKIEMLEKNPRVCVEIDEYLGVRSADKACDYGTRYRSLIAFGRARLVEEVGKKRQALQLLMEKYAGRSFEFNVQDIKRVGIIEILLEEMAGKQGE